MDYLAKPIPGLRVTQKDQALVSQSLTFFTVVFLGQEICSLFDQYYSPRDSSRKRELIPVGILCWFILLSYPALAVAPGLVGPLQALLQMLPQMLAALVALVGGIFSNSLLRLWARKHLKLCLWLSLLLLSGVLALVYSAQDRRQPLLATATPSELPEKQQWLSFRGSLNGGGSGALEGTPVPSVPNTRWMHSDPDKAQYLSSPVAVNGRCYVGASLFGVSNSFGAIECFDLKTGALQWRSLTRHPVFSSPIVADNRLYCGEGLHSDQDCKLYCLDAGSGKTIFTVATKGHVEAAPTLAGDKLLFTAGGDGLYCVAADSGHLIWHVNCGHSDSSVAVFNQRVYLGTAYGDNAVICLDLNNGKTIWKTPQNLSVWGHAAVGADTVFVGLGNGTFNGSHSRPQGALLALAAHDGKQLWRHDLPDSINTSLILTEKKILAGCLDGQVYCLDQADGSLLWKNYCGKPLLASLILQQQTVLVAGGDGYLHALDLNSGQHLWAYLVSAVACEASPMLNGSSLVLGCGGLLQCLGP